MGASTLVSTLYERLGVDASAGPGELKAAFRQRARELHPDINRDDADGQAMRQLNEAWAVLGDPETRRRYDAGLDEARRDAAAAERAAAAAERAAADQRPPGRAPAAPVSRPRPEADILPGTVSLGWWRLFRPSILIPTVLLLIFVVTAYAAHPGSGGTPPAPSKSTTSTGVITSPVADAGGDTTTTAGPNLVGSCIRNQSTSVLVVPCSEPPNSLVVAAVPANATCPAGTQGFLLAGQSEMVCATSSIP